VQQFVGIGIEDLHRILTEARQNSFQTGFTLFPPVLYELLA
jgi:hypothetical protein